MNDKKWNFLNYTLVWMDKFYRQTDSKTIRKITKKLTVLITRQIEEGDKTFKYTKLTFSIHISIHILTLKLILLVMFPSFFSSSFMDFFSVISVTFVSFCGHFFLFWPFLIGFGFNSSQCQWDNRLEY